MSGTFTRFKVRIGHTGNDSRVEMDGVDISHSLTGIRIETAVGETSTVVLTMLATVEAEGEAVIERVT